MILGWEHFLVIASIIMQVLVTVMAVSRAVKSMEKYRVTWSMLALVFGLMSFRRITSLGVALGINIPFSFPEVIAVIVSLLLCIAVYNIGKILPALEYAINKMPDASTELKRIASTLTAEIQDDIVDLDDFKTNGDSLLRSRENLNGASRKLVDIAHNLERLTGGEMFDEQDQVKKRVG